HQPWQIQVRDYGQRVSTLFRRCLYAVGFRRQLGCAAQDGSTEATVIKQSAEWFVNLSVTTDQSRCCDILFCHSERSAVEEALAVLSSTKKLEMPRLCSHDRRALARTRLL